MELNGNTASTGSRGRLMREKGTEDGKNGIWQNSAEKAENAGGKSWEMTGKRRKKRIIIIF
jgi:hypothetical protein